MSIKSADSFLTFLIINPALGRTKLLLEVSSNMKERLKTLLFSVERLGLDTQPIRDLLTSGLDLEDYSNRVTNLEREVSKHPPGSQPHQVQILVKHLTPRPKEASFKGRNINLTADNYVVQQQDAQTDPAVVETLKRMGNLLENMANKPAQQPAQQAPENNSDRVLEKIEELSNKVENIKISGPGVPEIDPDMPQMKEGFVDPMDEKEVEKLKGKVHITPKKGKPLTSSLNKLRKLKK